MNLRIAALGVFLLVCSVGNAQFFSQYDQPTNNLIETSPSMIGWHGAWSVNAAMGIRPKDAYNNNNEETFSLAVDGYVDKVKTAFGMSQNVLMSQKGQLEQQLGKHYVSSITSLAASPKIRLNERVLLMPALSYSLRVDRGFTSNCNGFNCDVVNSSEERVVIKNYRSIISMGAIIDKTFFNVDYHLSRSIVRSETSSNIQMNLGHNFKLNDLVITPHAAFAYDLYHSYELQKLWLNWNVVDGVYGSLRIGTRVRYKNIVLAARHALFSNGIVLGAGYILNERYRISYSVASASSLGYNASTHHEIGVRALLFKNRRQEAFISDLNLL